jgi:hypothetical protein
LLIRQVGAAFNEAHGAQMVDIFRSVALIGPVVEFQERKAGMEARHSATQEGN